MTTEANEGTNPEIEKKLLDEYRTELFELLEDFQSGRDGDRLQKTITQKLAIYQKQLSSIKAQFPNDEELDWFESGMYILQAYLKLGATGFAHRSIDRTDSLGGKLFLAAIAKGQNESNAREAVRLLTRAIMLDDNPGVRMLRASIHSSLKDKVSALKDVNHVLTNFADDQELYIEARKLKDEIEQESDGSCFIATAVYGSPEAPEVVLLRQFRDDTLVQSYWGKKFTECYYRYSPRIARKLLQSKPLAKSTKIILVKPAIWCVLMFNRLHAQFRES